MNVLSLFDGMSCGQIALDRLGIKVDKYYASEIDPYCISVTMFNYPNTIQLGDIRNVKASDLEPIDLILGGSPCQGFSFMGSRLDFLDERSKLFFDFVRLVNECKEINPDLYYLLENVRMTNESRAVITEALRADYIEIDSALVSAQRRRRLYWSNIPNITQPADRNLMLKDILIDGENNLPMYSNIHGGFNEKEPRITYDKSVTIRTDSGGGHIPSVAKNKIYNRLEKQKVIVRKHEIDINSLAEFLRNHKTKPVKEIAEHCQVNITQAEHWFRKDKYFAIPQPSEWYKLKEILNITTDKWDKQITEFEEREGVFDSAERITQIHGKNPTLIASQPNKIEDKYYYSQTMENYISDPVRIKKQYTAISDGNDKALPLTTFTPRGLGTSIRIPDKYYLSEKMKKTVTTNPPNYNMDNKNKIDPEKSPPINSTMHKGHRAYQDPYVSDNNYKPIDKSNIRKILPVEAERLQTVEDNYTAKGISDGKIVSISDSKRYTMLGNGWNVETICHILKNIIGNPEPKKPKEIVKQLELF